MNEDVALLAACSGIAFLAASILLLSRRVRWPGLVLGFFGLAAISLSTVWRTYLEPRVVDLKAQNIRLEKKLSDAQRLAGDLRAANDALQQELVVAKARDDHSAVQLRRLDAELLNASQQVAELQKERLKSKLRSGFASSYYQIELLAEKELIAATEGDYFLVRLLDGASKPFVFDERIYSLAGAESLIRESAKRFTSEILIPIAVSKNVELFIRGGADSRPIDARDETGIAKPPLSILIKGDVGKYVRTPHEMQLGPVVRNEDLPALRADYLRNLILPVFGLKEMPILANPPAMTPERSARTAELVIYIDW